MFSNWLKLRMVEGADKLSSTALTIYYNYSFICYSDTSPASPACWCTLHFRVECNIVKLTRWNHVRHFGAPSSHPLLNPISYIRFSPTDLSHWKTVKPRREEREIKILNEDFTREASDHQPKRRGLWRWHQDLIVSSDKSTCHNHTETHTQLG